MHQIIHIASAENKLAMLQTSLLISGDCVTRLVLFHGPKSLRHIFLYKLSPNFLNGMINEGRTRRKQSLWRRS